MQFASAEAMHQACKALDGSEILNRQIAMRPQEAGQKATPAEAVPNCWFCLSNEQSDKRLVISVGALPAWCLSVAQDTAQVSLTASSA